MAQRTSYVLLLLLVAGCAHTARSRDVDVVNEGPNKDRAQTRGSLGEPPLALDMEAWQQDTARELTATEHGSACRRELATARRAAYDAQASGVPRAAAHTSTTTKLDPRLHAWALMAPRADELGGFLIKVVEATPPTHEALSRAGFVITSTTGAIYAGRAAVRDLYCIAALPGVVKLEGGGKYLPES